MLAAPLWLCWRVLWFGLGWFRLVLAGAGLVWAGVCVGVAAGGFAAVFGLGVVWVGFAIVLGLADGFGCWLGWVLGRT